MEAHPDAQVGAPGPRVRGERALCRDGGGDGVPGSFEAEEERIALRVDLLTVPHGELVANEAPVLGENLGVPVAEPLDKLGRAGDVREDERDRAAAQHVRRHQALSRCSSSRSDRRRRTRGFASFTISSR